MGSAALVLTSLTKNLIRSGLKFNHSLKELILGAIGGWCPLHLIVAQLLYPVLSGFAVSLDYTRLRFFLPLLLFRLILALFRATIELRNNLLCIDIKLCYLIELPSSSRLKRHGWQHFLAWAEFKGFRLNPFSGLILVWPVASCRCATKKKWNSLYKFTIYDSKWTRLCMAISCFIAI